ncbi:MAG: hypothetical protein HFG80_09830 [Eubacterium sp.]|nr:hypothetical protein [Eubacterium sp.]
MDREKELWLESIGAKAFPEPIKYVYMFPGYSGAFNLSERYIDETPIGELQETYRRNGEFVALIKERGRHEMALWEKMESIVEKYAGLVEKRISNTENLSGEDLRDIYDGIHSLGYIVASLERLYRMEEEKAALTED